MVLVAYAHGIVSSRAIEAACREHVTFIALCGDTAPHFTTIAHFVSTLGEDIAHVFGAVVAICDDEGLISHEMFAIDGIKFPSNASKARSGTRADMERHATKLEAAARTIVARHRAADAWPAEPTLVFKDGKRIARLEQDATQLRAWLADHPEERRGPKGTVRQSNRTDSESAKMATSKGVIQGYTGVAAVDKANQIIVEAQARGTGSEQEVLLSMVTAMAPVLTEASLITADAGYHSEANLKDLAARDVDALIADGAMRKRDERFATQDRHQAKPDPLHDKAVSTRALPISQPSDFTYDVEARTCVCPAGEALYRKGQPVKKGLLADQYQGATRDCGPCARRAQWLRTLEKTTVRQVAFFHGKDPAAPKTHTARMQARIDTPEGRARNAERFGAVEPVFANLRFNKRLDRCTLRGRAKVDGQWKLFCLVQNIEKLAHHGYAA